MAATERNVKMTVRLSRDEETIRKLLEIRLGTDGNSVMRQGMLEMAERKGIHLPQKSVKQKNGPSHKDSGRGGR
jgi:tetrahydromethanopterin S-methyltransferase subunit H